MTQYDITAISYGLYVFNNLNRDITLTQDCYLNFSNIFDNNNFINTVMIEINYNYVNSGMNTYTPTSYFGFNGIYQISIFPTLSTNESLKTIVFYISIKPVRSKKTV